MLKPVVLGAFVALLLYKLYNYIALETRRRHFKQSAGCQPLRKYPQKDPILGLDVFRPMLKHLKEGGFPAHVAWRYKNAGMTTFTIDVLGTRFIHTIDPENVKAMLATQFHDFDLPWQRKPTFAPVFGHGIFTNSGHDWETSRALLRPNFNRAQVADLETMETHVAKVIARIPKDGSTVDLQQLFFSLTMDTATEFLFGHSSRTLDAGATHERGVRFAEAFTDSTHHIGTLVRVHHWLWPFLKSRKFAGDAEYIDAYISEYVQKAIDMHKNGTKKSSERYIFLEELAATGSSKEKIKAELMNILLAGRDTTAGLLSYLFYKLAREKDVFAKLKAEIEQLEGKQPTYETVKGMKYLQWTLNEALRLFPLVPLNAREALKDTTLPMGGGPDGKSPIFVPKGMLLSYHPYAMHRRTDMYGPDAEEFRPERWESLRPGWAYVPFNGGPRICIGQQYALMEASYTTIRLLQTFKSLEPRDDRPYAEMLTLTASVVGGVKVACIPHD